MSYIIAQISDLHICEEGSAMDKNIDTAGFLQRAVAHLNQLPNRPDLLVITGDLVEARTAGEYERLKNLLSDLTMPFFMIPGNHDRRDAMRLAFPDHEYLQQGPDEFIQYEVNDGPVRLLMLDSLVEGKPHGELCSSRLNWLAERLDEDGEKPTMIFLHHPPFKSGLVPMDNMGLKNRDAFLQIVAARSNILRLQCGHLHRPITRLVAGTIAATAPSCAHQLGLQLNNPERLEVSFEPPACLLHVWLGEEDGLVTHTSYIGEFRNFDVLEQVRKKLGKI